MEFEYWRNLSLFLPLSIWASSSITVQEMKLPKLQVPCSLLKIHILRQPSIPVRQSTMVSLRCQADSSKWTTTEKMHIIALHASLMMSLMSSPWSLIQHSSPRTLYQQVSECIRILIHINLRPSLEEIKYLLIVSSKPPLVEKIWECPSKDTEVMSIT